MADPICRWRNPYPKTVSELVNTLPHETMSSESFRKYMGTTHFTDDFFRTPYQLACQLGLYYETNDGQYIPRFNKDIDDTEAQKYLEHWITKYYVPNPYNKKTSFPALETPILFLRSIVDYREQHPNETDLKTICESIFKDTIGNLDIVKNVLNNYSEIVTVDSKLNISLKPNYKETMQQRADRNDKKAFFENFDSEKNKQPENSALNKVSEDFRPYVTAIKSKPFILLAGISGTGKSRIVRELARACYDEGSEGYRTHKPANFEMIQVRPNWHDSTELLGYVSRINGDKYIAGDFLKFIVKAWENPDMPHFLCLDEMNLAPVEQYFAEYLSVIESRKLDDNGDIITDPILKKAEEQWYVELIHQITTQEKTSSQFLKKGISIPQNLVVMGTVNMDETTFSFSRKVLDRAMSVEMNEVDLYGGLEGTASTIGKLDAAALTGTAVEGKDVYTANKEVCDKVLQYLETINEKLECTPFKVAYRTRNEFLLYVVNNLPYTGEGRTQEEMIATALDEITSMKILSRIEGDESKIAAGFLSGLKNVIKEKLNDLSGKEYVENKTSGKEGNVLSVSLKKLAEMEKKLQDTGYTSYWC